LGFITRLTLAGSLVLGAVTYVAFALVGSSVQFILVRALQGVAVTGTGLMSLALVGELAPMLGGVLMGIGMQWVFVVGAIAAFSGVLTVLGILSRSYGMQALTEW
jgi:MFS family permease